MVSASIASNSTLSFGFVATFLPLVRVLPDLREGVERGCVIPGVVNELLRLVEHGARVLFNLDCLIGIILVAGGSGASVEGRFSWEEVRSEISSVSPGAWPRGRRYLEGRPPAPVRLFGP